MLDSTKTSCGKKRLAKNCQRHILYRHYFLELLKCIDQFQPHFFTDTRFGEIYWQFSQFVFFFRCVIKIVFSKAMVSHSCKKMPDIKHLLSQKWKYLKKWGELFEVVKADGG